VRLIAALFVAEIAFAIAVWRRWHAAAVLRAKALQARPRAILATLPLGGNRTPMKGVETQRLEVLPGASRSTCSFTAIEFGWRCFKDAIFASLAFDPNDARQFVGSPVINAARLAETRQTLSVTGKFSSSLHYQIRPCLTGF
jgi:hypothetical protein